MFSRWMLLKLSCPNRHIIFIAYTILLLQTQIKAIPIQFWVVYMNTSFHIWERCLQRQKHIVAKSSSYLHSGSEYDRNTSSMFHIGRGISIGSVFAWHASGPEFDPHVRHILLWRLGYENISTAILSLPLIQEEQLSVTGERMCTKYW